MQFYLHDMGRSVTLVTSDGESITVPVEVLKAFAREKVAHWGEESQAGLEAIRNARPAAQAFPAIASCQRFARVLTAANSMADTTMLGLREDLEFYALNIQDCARLMEEIDMDAAEVIQAMENIEQRGENGLSSSAAAESSGQAASNEVGSDVADARSETEQAAAQASADGGTGAGGSGAGGSGAGGSGAGGSGTAAEQTGGVAQEQEA